jgi:hypothetical protein
MVVREIPKIHGMRKKRFRIGILASFLLFTLSLSGVFIVYRANIDIPYLCYSGPAEGIWSIGIYDLDVNGRSIKLQARPGNPILTAADIKDIPARFVADPFLIQEKETFYLFFEVLGVDRGVIGLATSADGHQWRYERIVLEEPFHLSYPNVFKWKGDYYLVPESAADKSVRLYKATHFPDEWQFVKPIIADRTLVDSTVLIHQGLLWLFCSSPDNQNLYLFYADQPEGPWREHPGSPVVKGNARDARPAGNILDTGERLIRFSQDSRAIGEKYGKAVRGFEIMTLTREEYRERPVDSNPILEASEKGWNSEGMHQLSPVPVSRGRWITAVDGKRRSDQYIFCLGKTIFRVP